MVFKLYRLLSHPSVSCLPTKFESKPSTTGKHRRRTTTATATETLNTKLLAQTEMDSIPGLELFSSYEQEFNDLVISIRNALNVEAKNSVGEQRKAVLRRVERDYEEAEEILSQMDVELQSLDRASSRPLILHIKRIRFIEFNKRKTAQRERLLRSQQVLESSSNRLDSSHRIALETEIRVRYLRDLRGQREQIENTRDTLREADGHLDKASNTLNKMIRREWKILSLLLN
ncbi:hypothetical protein H4Q26_001138 [Puccinia striiformis f. sp. tritici PST-130]|nr:hypothetical protein H4Q26_001138 [Puccinia striiformis f. sp. tritici PST-130]